MGQLAVCRRSRDYPLGPGASGGPFGISPFGSSELRPRGGAPGGSSRTSPSEGTEGPAPGDSDGLPCGRPAPFGRGAAWNRMGGSHAPRTPRTGQLLRLGRGSMDPVLARDRAQGGNPDGRRPREKRNRLGSASCPSESEEAIVPARVGVSPSERARGACFAVRSTPFASRGRHHRKSSTVASTDGCPERKQTDPGICPSFGEPDPSMVDRARVQVGSCKKSRIGTTEISAWGGSTDSREIALAALPRRANRR